MVWACYRPLDLPLFTYNIEVMIVVVAGPLPQALAGWFYLSSSAIGCRRSACTTRKGIKQISVTLWATSYPYTRSVTEAAHNQPRPPPGWAAITLHMDHAHGLSQALSSEEGPQGSHSGKEQPPTSSMAILQLIDIEMRCLGLASRRCGVAGVGHPYPRPLKYLPVFPKTHQEISQLLPSNTFGFLSGSLSVAGAGFPLIVVLLLHH